MSRDRRDATTGETWETSPVPMNPTSEAEGGRVDALLPCPWCGELPMYDPENDGVFCDNGACVLKDMAAFVTPKRWNTRTPPPADERHVAKDRSGDGFREVTLEDAGTLRDTFLRKRVWPADNLAMNSAMLDCLRSIGAVIRTDGQQAQPE